MASTNSDTPPDGVKKETSCTSESVQENNLVVVDTEKTAKKKAHKKKKTGASELTSDQKNASIKLKSKKKAVQSGFAKKLHSAQLELERIKNQQEEEERKKQEELQKELEKQKLEEERKETRKLKEKARKKRLKEEGKLLSRSQKEKIAKNKESLKKMLEQGATCFALNNNQSEAVVPSSDILVYQKPQNLAPPASYYLSDKHSSESEEINEISKEIQPLQIRSKPSISDPVLRIQQRIEESRTYVILDKLRSPIICVMGHVDTGKTKILDKLRNTRVQDGEAGGITQQIGVTNVPLSAVKQNVAHCPQMSSFEYKISGLSIIDTPGHFSFRNLRSLGSSLCDMAILVVDIMHSIEQQTEESIKLLISRKTPFVVALNKIDLIVGWRSVVGMSIDSLVTHQSKVTQQHFEDLFKKTFAKFAELGLNLALSYNNKDPHRFISAVPTSAHTGDGIGDLISYICQYSQANLTERLTIKRELGATVMEVKTILGLGSTIDVILVNGTLRRGDRIVVGGIEGPLVSQIRALLTPQPLKEMRVKGTYQHHDIISGSQGVKIAGPNLEEAVAGLPLFVAEYEDEVGYFSNQMASLVSQTLKAFNKKDKGVYVQASTLGSLEALLDFLRESKIPYFGFSIGPVHRRDVINAMSMVEQDPMHAVVLAFDVKVDVDAQILADKTGVRIFTADIIYHLYDQYVAYEKAYKKQIADKFKHLAVFPCVLRILPDCVFKTRDPIVVGVHVEDGSVKVGTPLCVPTRGNLVVGVVGGIEINHRNVEVGKKGQDVCIKIGPSGEEAPRALGRHFEVTDELVSKISRDSIDIMKDYFRDDLTKQDWLLIKRLKTTFDIL